MLSLQGSLILVLVLGYVSAGPKKKCEAGERFLQVKKGQDDFDVDFAITKGEDNEEILKKGKGVSLMNSDVVSLDADYNEFTLKKICIKTKRATEVKFQFFGEDLKEVAGGKTFTIKESKKSYAKSCMAGPEDELLLAVWVTVKRAGEPLSYKIDAKSLSMDVCFSE